MPDGIDKELGVDEEYADEIRERIDDAGPTSLFGAVVRPIKNKRLQQAEKSGEWIAMLVGAITEGIRETERIVLDLSEGGEAARKHAVSLYQERMVERVLDGTIFDPLDEDHPETFRKILVERFPEWAAEKAYRQVRELQGLE